MIEENNNINPEEEETSVNEEIEMPDIDDDVDSTKVFGADVQEELNEYSYEDESDDTAGPTGPKKDNRKVLIGVIAAAIVVVVIVAVVLLTGNRGSGPTVTPGNTPNATATSETEDPWYDAESDTALWDEQIQINDDYVGEIRFESGFINLPVVQHINENNITAGYTVYLRTNWETMEYDEEGSIFVDPYCDIEESQNIVIYGHYVYPSYEPSMTHMFTPLALLTDEANYEENKIFALILEDEIRIYEIAHVYYAQINLSSVSQPLEAGMEYMKPDWTEDELEYYLSRVSEEEFYDTGVEITSEDKFVTLQTCVENRDDLREIVIAKEIQVIETR